MQTKLSKRHWRSRSQLHWLHPRQWLYVRVSGHIYAKLALDFWDGRGREAPHIWRYDGEEKQLRVKIADPHLPTHIVKFTCLRWRLKVVADCTYPLPAGQKFNCAAAFYSGRRQKPKSTPFGVAGVERPAAYSGLLSVMLNAYYSLNQYDLVKLKNHAICYWLHCTLASWVDLIF